MFVLRPDPKGMLGVSEGEVTRPSRDLRDFVSWYRHWIGESPESLEPYLRDLREIFDGFLQMRLRGAEGERRRSLRFEFSAGKGGPCQPYEFAELSDGQRSLVVLYAILHFTVRPDVTVFLDEPENFLALAEIQPWVVAMQSEVDRQRSQMVMISHHPELLDLLAPESGWLFSRPEGGPVRVDRFPIPADSLLRPSERVARGWESDE